MQTAASNAIAHARTAAIPFMLPALYATCTLGMVLVNTATSRALVQRVLRDPLEQARQRPAVLQMCHPPARAG